MNAVYAIVALAICGVGLELGFVRVDQESKAWAICQWPSADGGRRVWGLTPSACRRLHVLEANCGGGRSEPGTAASPPEMKTVVPKTGIMPQVKRDLTFAEGRLDTVNFVDMRVFARATVQRSTVVDA